MDIDSAFRAEREKNALQSFDGSVEMQRKQLPVDNLDEIRRVTDTKYIAMTESLHDCHFGTLQLCVRLEMVSRRARLCTTLTSLRTGLLT